MLGALQLKLSETDYHGKLKFVDGVRGRYLEVLELYLVIQPYLTQQRMFGYHEAQGGSSSTEGKVLGDNNLVDFVVEHFFDFEVNSDRIDYLLGLSIIDYVDNGGVLCHHIQLH